MSQHDLTARFDLRVNPQDPSTWLEPGQTLVGADGRDWAWCYVVYEEVAGFPAYCVGTNGSAWSRWERDYDHLDGRGASYVIGTTWQRMTPAETNHGYLCVMLCGEESEKKRIYRRLHGLILSVFVGPCPKGQMGRHLNGKRHDCRLSNLAWGTGRENQADRVRHGTDNRGERGAGAVLSRDDVAEIRRLHAAGMKKAEIARRFRVTRTNVYCIVTHKTWIDV